MYRIKKILLPPVPPSLASTVIPQDMHYNDTKQQLCNSATSHKVVAFVSELALKILSDNRHGNVGEAFRTSPALFIQVYYMYDGDKHSMKPIVYLCCEDKSKERYEHFFRSLVDYAV